MIRDNNGLRFAALVRVSTERQLREGESLATQKKDIGLAVRNMGASIVEWYGGQEHATPGFEKKEIDRLLNDARGNTRRFDAVMVAHADRWSRDNTKSREGLEVFEVNKVRFFVGEEESDLFDPDTVLYLGMSAVIGHYHALRQAKGSLNNRINRAKRGWPACGKLPFGRVFCKDTGRWDVIPSAQAIMKDVAARYLSGERLPDLAREYRMNHSNLHKVLMQRCGPEWEQTFESKRLQIKETVMTAIPPLLDAKTISALRAKSAANRTYHHGSLRNKYLFSRMIHCAHCGYAMFGQTNHGGARYYRHYHTHRDRPCTGPSMKPWLRADELEDMIMRHLFECFGNPVAVAKAIEEATPNRDKVNAALRRIERVEANIAEARAGKERILRLVAKGSVSEQDAENQLSVLNKDQERFGTELAHLVQSVDHVPSPAKIRQAAESVANCVRQFRSARVTAKLHDLNSVIEAMTWDERRHLAEMVFGGKTADGKRMGIYIEWPTNKADEALPKWRYTIHGHLIEETGVLPVSETRKAAMFVFGAAHKQKRLAKVTESALHSRGIGPRRSRWPPLPTQPLA